MTEPADKLIPRRAQPLYLLASLLGGPLRRVAILTDRKQARSEAARRTVASRGLVRYVAVTLDEDGYREV